MSVQLYVGNLPYEVTEKELTELFSTAGAPSRVRLPVDRETGKPRGFAFVEYSDPAQAQGAIQRFDKNLFKGRPLSVNEARPREEGAARTGGARPGGYVADFSPADAPTRPAAGRRNFGPDALPRNKRKTENRGSKKEGRPSTTVRQAGRGGASTEPEPDDVLEEVGLDDFACWARDDADDPEKE
jgi:RNA recognition motif-containing protein